MHKYTSELRADELGTGRINYCPAALGGRHNKKADFRHFLNSSILSAKSVQVISPYTSNASDNHTVLHTLWLKTDHQTNLPAKYFNSFKKDSSL
jgi:hypothetical protein